MCTLQVFLQPGNPKFSTFCHVKSVSPSGVNKFFFHLVVFPAVEESSIYAPPSGDPTFSNTFPTTLQITAVKRSDSNRKRGKSAEVIVIEWDWRGVGGGVQIGVALSDELGGA